MVSNGWLTIAIFMVFFAPEVFGSGKEFVGVALGWRKPRKRAGGSKILMQHASRIGRRLAAELVFHVAARAHGDDFSVADEHGAITKDREFTHLRPGARVHRAGKGDQLGAVHKRPAIFRSRFAHRHLPPRVPQS